MPRWLTARIAGALRAAATSDKALARHDVRDGLRALADGLLLVVGADHRVRLPPPHALGRMTVVVATSTHAEGR